MDFLENVNVVEFSHMVMGPSSGMILGDLGAKVVKVEPVGGDKTRRLPGSGSGYFSMFNRNKQSLCVDVKSEEGRRIVHRLLQKADVVIENFRPGALDKLGLGYEDVRAINPDVVYQSSKGFLSGPYERRTALDEVAQMMGGLAYMTGPEGRPLRAGASVIDIAGGMFGVIGILAALVRRAERGGGGTHITSSLFETTVFLVGQHIAQQAVTGRPVRPMPSRVSAWAVYDVFEAEDGQVFVGVVSDGQWRTFCEVFGFEEWRDDARFASNAGRVEHRDTIIPALRETFGGMTKAALVSRLDEAGLPFAPINRPEDLLNDPQVMPGGMYELRLPDRDRSVFLPKLPIEADGARPGAASDPPGAGQHTEAILADLGFDEADIRRLRERGVVG